MNLLQEELRDLQINASHNEATIRKLSQTIIVSYKSPTPCCVDKDNDTLNKQLFKEKQKLSQVTSHDHSACSHHVHVGSK